MGRDSFLIKFTRDTASGTDAYRTSCSCLRRVSNFLGIEDKIYTPSEGDLADRAEYTRSYTKADGTEGEVTVKAGKKIYLANTKAGAKKIQLLTGAKTKNGTRKTVQMSYPSFMSVAEIADSLGELLAGKVAVTGTTSANEVDPFFSLVGGRTYPIVPNAAAVASTKTEVATTEAKQVTIVTGTKSRTRKKKTP